jgi:hypothetical protein
MDQTENTEIEEPMEEDTIKRGRGRPMTRIVDPEEVEREKRPVGRPPNPNKKGRKPYIPTGGTRGRPKKPEHLKIPPKKRTYKRVPEHLKKPAGRKRTTLPFEKARSIILDETIGSNLQYIKWYKFNRPSNIPRNPDQIYKDCWIGWNHYLGNNNVSFAEQAKNRNYMSYDDAHEKIRKFGLKKYDEWRELVKSGKLPEGIPKRPDLHYRKNWISWKQFLGYNHLDRIIEEVSATKYLFVAKYYNMPQNVFKIDVTNVKLEKMVEYARHQQFRLIKVYEYEEGFDYKMFIMRYGQPYWGGEQGDYELYNVHSLIMDFDTRMMPARL